MIPRFDHHLQLDAGEVIGGRYIAVRRIARGGMGEVWSVRHEKLEAEFAMKLLAPVYGVGDDTVARFELEARIAARLGRGSHYIVPVLDFGEHHNRPFLVMPLVSGPSLEQLLAPGALVLIDAARVVRHVGRALTAAHREGVLHRDLKPGNVLVAFEDDRFFAKVTDFGIARVVGAEHVTEHGALLGTPYYMSPEQANGEEVDARCDVWALSCLAYRCVVGRDAFHGRSPLEILGRVCTSTYDPPTTINRELPPELDALFARAFARDVAARYREPRAFADAFASATATSAPRGRDRTTVPAHPSLH